MFPSPLEVDRFISVTGLTAVTIAVEFPSPLEVDRFISSANMDHDIEVSESFRPLSR